MIAQKMKQKEVYIETKSTLLPHEIQEAFDLIDSNGKINGSDIPSLP